MIDNPYKYPFVPIGGIIEFDPTGLQNAPDMSTPENVAKIYGYGTWERYGVDRMTVGAGGDYTAGATGGEESHVLTVDEIAIHEHRTSGSYVSLIGGNAENSTGQIASGTGTRIITADKVATTKTGGGKAHNNMPPYIGVYRYRRIA